ncbi:BON domain-containing protein [Tautonia rosea]|uniref:BON domain-containing protein n=1 Tax=Tautonia rosea TaxID=2728037 RepID=UPI0014727172|nr:BON domain-containing protein [Tautonia rosea]
MKMLNHQGAWLAALALIGTASTAEAQILRPEGPAEQVGQVVGGALDTAGRAVERSLRTAFSRTRGAVESMEVTSRVYSRLLWEKELTGSRFVIDARPGGVVILRGSVPTPEAADRAAALAISTVGVSRVFNELVAPEGTTTTVLPGSTTDRPLGELRSEPILEPLPRTEPQPNPGAEPGLEPLRRSEPRQAPEPETPVEPTPSIRPPLPTP